ncbi:hypothetical protein [Leptospira weilii]|uniref:hypothetical protein n=1 Tax=Leptospira weilii TaxID=28184 RepID=UPI003B969D25
MVLHSQSTRSFETGSKFHGGFVGIPTDLSSDPSICGVGYVREQHFSFLFAQTHVKLKLLNFSDIFKIASNQVCIFILYFLG